MCEVMDRIYSEGEKIGIQIGEERGIRIGEERGRIEMKQETSRILSKMGMTVEQIALAVTAGESEVRKWLD